MFRRLAMTAAMAACCTAPLAAQQKAAKANPLMKDAKVTEEAARASALAKVPGGKVTESELEREKGKLIWSFDITVAGKPGVEEVQVDAVTGAVLAVEHETPRAEAKEKAAEKAKKKP
jgi:uncharacterized membrane protein YkoI